MNRRTNLLTLHLKGRGEQRSIASVDDMAGSRNSTCGRVKSKASLLQNGLLRPGSYIEHSHLFFVRF
jgi:hypothetical protein